MAITVNNILVGNSEIDGPYTTTSWIPVGTRSYLLSVITRSGISVDPPVPVITGNNITWVTVASVVYDSTTSSRKRSTLFSGFNVSPSTGVTTITIPGQVQSNSAWIIDEVDTGDATSVVQSVSAVNESFTSPTQTVTLGVFSSINNGTYGVFASDGAPVVSSRGTGFSAGAQSVTLGEIIASEWRNDNDTTVDITWSLTGAQGGIAVELKPTGALSDNLISFWELEEATNATRLDSVTVTGNNLTSNAGVTQQVGIVGNAAGFALTSSQYLSRTSNSTLQFGNKDWTVCAWAYLNSLPASDMQVVSKQQSGAGEYSMVWKPAGPRFLLDIKAGSGTYVLSLASSVIVTTATWYMVVTSFTAATGIGSISVNDGVVDTAAKTGNPGVDNTLFCIGARATPGEFFNGRIDQVGKWNRVLTAAEITYLYNGGAGRSYAEISGGGPIDGGLTSIEQKDIAAFSGAKTFFGTIGALEQLDTAAFAGTMIPKFVTGNIAAIEVKDAARFLGDTFTPGIDGGIGATEQRDIAAFSGAKTYFGSIAATEFRDAAAFSGTMIPKFVTGTLAVTEVKDVARVVGDTNHPGAVDGGLGATEQRDTAAFAGAKTYFGTIGAVEGIDLATFNGTAFRLSNGSLAVIEFKDTAAFRGDVFAPGTVLGDVHPVEQRDIAAFSGAKTFFGTIGALEVQDRAAFSGTMIPKFVSGSIGAVEQKDIAFFDARAPEDTVSNDIAMRDANTGIGCSPQTKWKDGAPVGWDGTNIPTAIGLIADPNNFQNIGGVNRQCRLLQAISNTPAGTDILPGWFSYVDVVTGEWVWCVNRTVIAGDMDNPIGFGSV